MPRTKTKAISPAPRKYNRRSEEQLIADLEAKIQGIKSRAARKAVKKDPTLRHVTKAIRAIDKAVETTGDAATRRALEEARTTLSACLQLSGEAVPQNGRSSGAPARDAVLAYVRANPGQRSEQIAAAMGTDSRGLRSPMKRLVDEGRVKTKGQRRGMQYWAE